MQTVARLINQFIPESYNLSLNIDRKKRTFHGLVTIKGRALAKSVQLHNKDLDIGSVVLNGRNARFSRSGDEMTVEGATIGTNIIVISYDGKIDDALHGLYPCYCSGNKEELLVTQFESHHAREVFPCVDEPEAKATFDLALTTETGVTVLGNMPIKSQKEESGVLVTEFGTTPVMSTYLLAFVIGTLQKKSGRTKNGVEVNVWSTPEHNIDSLDFALDVAIRSTDFYNEYFGTDYPLPKCDHVALPDFGSGAMENWGLITYREMALLADPESTSISSRRYIATVIAHEISHQWFGNLVTMKWWNDLWLNESFASLIEYTCVDDLEPTWNAWLDFSSYDAIAALRRDSLEGVQSVQTEVKHPDEIGALFDGAIVYAKGARLLQMLQHLIGEAAFRKGLKAYFKKFAYQNTEADDLWQSLSETSGMDVKSFMDAWIKQPGYPILSVKTDGEMLTISQNKMTTLTGNASDSLWPITPNSNHPDVPKVFNNRDVTLTLKHKITEPIRFNVGDFAHFVTNYDSAMLAAITEMIQNNQLSTIDRLQFLAEQSLLARAGQVPNDRLVRLLTAYKHESSEAVWDVISTCIADLKKFVEQDAVAEKQFKKFVAMLAQEQYDRLGWLELDGEPEDDTKLRSTIISKMLYAEEPAATSRAIELYKTQALDDIDPELRSLVLAAAVRQPMGGPELDKLIELYKLTPKPELKSDLRAGLTSTKDITLIRRLLALVKDQTAIKSQDATFWFANLLFNKYGCQEAWDWVRSNWDWVDKTYGSDKSYDDYARYTAGALTTAVQLKQYRDFFEPMLNDPALTRTIAIGIKDIDNRVRLIERDSQGVIATLNNL